MLEIKNKKMTEQEKTFIAREFDKLENQLDSKYALYENGYQSALFDALEVVNKLPIHNVSKSFYCQEKEALNQKCESVCDVCSNWAFRFRYYKQR